MRARGRGRWETRFGAWVSRVTVEQIVAELSVSKLTEVTNQGVYRWLAGATSPTPDRARALVNISGGALTIDAIYSHRDEMNNQVDE